MGETILPRKKDAMFMVRYLKSEAKDEWVPILEKGTMYFDYGTALKLKREWEARGYRVKIG